ncbi:tripartite tricarboxylate transporter TctB family protein [Puniceibacterium sp. IMCC21224]|uniref:tripartite tricarboxylate transporter TctB family protein n=1 Tax=Puniceibacterium sp. IMCC21224 TaxID=1618204 RepID=UPI00065CF388|nr:tripartite tricarboxylate transporter TctB family protein [Puniceibacterium sp. IMCC21224]KMK68954.1 Tripartite tricarboxylate transporter TctB family [Puniceibacterium sp. IMCC21224]
MAVNRFMRAGILFPLVLIVVTTIYMGAAFGIRSQFSTAGEISPRAIPMLTAGMMYLALMVVLIQELRSGPDETVETSGGAFLRPALVLGATAAYILLFRPLGYSLSTLLFVGALFLVFGFETRRPLRFTLYAITVTVVFYGLFAFIFGVRLPAFPGLAI